jgi:GTPase
MDSPTNKPSPLQTEELKGTNPIAEQHLHSHIRVAMLGNVDSGKSTTTATLVAGPGKLDDGRGSLRLNVFNFDHERANGRTSSIGHEIMGFKADGTQFVTSLDHTNKKNKIWPDVVANSSKIVLLLDMCGHEKYLKTTMHGMSSLFPDYAMLLIGGNMGLSRMTKEHLFIAMTLDLPIFVVLTKTDIAPEAILKENLKQIAQLLKNHCAKVPFLVKDAKNVSQLADKIQQGKVAPIFQISNHTGEGLDSLRAFLSQLAKPLKQKKEGVRTHEDISTQFVIDDCYMSKGLGLILCGSVLRGQIAVNQTLMFGPDRNGNFKALKVKDIHQTRVPISLATEGTQCTLKVKQIGKNDQPISQDHIRKGSFLINPIEKKAKGHNPYHDVCTKYFAAKIKIRNHHTTICENYSAVMHVGGIRQTAQILKIKANNCLRVGDCDTVLFRLQYGVDIIGKGEKLMLREGATRAVGYVTETWALSTPAEEVLAAFQQ